MGTCRGGPRHGELDRRSRHFDACRRCGRGTKHGRRLRGRRLGAFERPDRLGQVQHRTPQGSGGRGRAAQSHPCPAPQAVAAEHRSANAQPQDRIRPDSVLRQHRAQAVGRLQGGSTGGRQRIRFRRHEFSRGARGARAWKDSTQEPNAGVVAHRHGSASRVWGRRHGRQGAVAGFVGARCELEGGPHGEARCRDRRCEGGTGARSSTTCSHRPERKGAHRHRLRGCGGAGEKGRERRQGTSSRQRSRLEAAPASGCLLSNRSSTEDGIPLHRPRLTVCQHAP